MTIYLELTREFNAGALRAVICSAPAAVLHRLAIASKDGDWILREEPEALDHVLGVLARRGARYRFGAPLLGPRGRREELCAWWDLWLHHAQSTNDLDEHLYSHGVFRVEPGWKITPEGVVRAD